MKWQNNDIHENSETTKTTFRKKNRIMNTEHRMMNKGIMQLANLVFTEL
jgi:hypothetical protein